jgi:hypothetical protein
MDDFVAPRANDPNLKSETTDINLFDRVCLFVSSYLLFSQNLCIFLVVTVIYFLLFCLIVTYRSDECLLHNILNLTFTFIIFLYHAASVLIPVLDITSFYFMVLTD